MKSEGHLTSLIKAFAFSSNLATDVTESIAHKLWIENWSCESWKWSGKCRGTDGWWIRQLSGSFNIFAYAGPPRPPPILGCIHYKGTVILDPIVGLGQLGLVILNAA